MRELAVYHTLLAVFYVYRLFRGGLDDTIVYCAGLQAFIAYCQWESYRRAPKP